MILDPDPCLCLSVRLSARRGSPTPFSLAPLPLPVRRVVLSVYLCVCRSASACSAHRAVGVLLSLCRNVRLAETSTARILEGVCSL